MFAKADLTVRGALREKGTPYAELGLVAPALSDEQLLNATLLHPILINRPFVVTPFGVRLRRPSEVVLDIPPEPDMTLCATNSVRTIDDLLEPMNRTAYSLKDGLDSYVARPVAVGYTKTMPEPVRIVVRDFFSNIGDIGPVLMWTSRTSDPARTEPPAHCRGETHDSERDFRVKSNRGLLSVR